MLARDTNQLTHQIRLTNPSVTMHTKQKTPPRIIQRQSQTLIEQAQLRTTPHKPTRLTTSNQILQRQ
jgi:hypothetical protein